MRAKIDNRNREVEMISKDGNKVEISVDGKIYDIDVVMSESGFCSKEISQRATIFCR